MAATVQLDTETIQHVGIPFDALVLISGAPAGAKATVTLVQTRGRPPLWGPKSQSTTIRADGTAVVPFNGIVLEGPTEAVLLASVVDDKGTFYPSDAERIRVL